MLPEPVKRWWGPLALITAAALLLRLPGLAFGLPLQTHPDEPQVLAVAVNAADGLLSPHFFAYGAVFPYLSGLVIRLYTLVAWSGDFRAFFDLYCEDPSEAILVVRACSAALGAGAVALTGLLGERLGGRATGLLAAAVLAVDVLAVRDAHFATVDTCTMFLAVAALLAMAHQRWVVAGLLVGLAAGTKYPAVLLVLPLLFAGRRAPLALGAAALAFFLSNPFVLLDFSTFQSDLAREAARRTATAPEEYPSAAWWYYLCTSLPWALGWPGLAALVGGGALALRRRSLAVLPAALFALATFALISTFVTCADRYLLPAHPVFAVFIGLGLSRLPWAVLLVLPPMAWGSVTVDRLLRLPDTREVAGEWLAANLPEGSSVALEWAYVPVVDPERVSVSPLTYDETSGWVVMSSYAFNRYHQHPAAYGRELRFIAGLPEPVATFYGLPAERALDWVERVPPGPMDQRAVQGPQIRVFRLGDTPGP